MADTDLDIARYHYRASEEYYERAPTDWTRNSEVRELLNELAAGTALDEDFPANERGIEIEAELQALLDDFIDEHCPARNIEGDPDEDWIWNLESVDDLMCRAVAGVVA